MTVPFLDTNILLRHITGDDAILSPRASACIAGIERGELTVRTTDIVIFETVFTLQSFYKMPRPVIRDTIVAILDFDGLELPGKTHFRSVFDLYVEHAPLSFADCYYVVLMRRLGLNQILSFDQGFDRLPDIERQEPG
jgi:predicted nucleic acid-binding protein